MSVRAWMGALLALHAGVLFAKAGAASCINDVGKARADRMVMHCERVNTTTQSTCAFMDCTTLSSVVQAFCGNPHARPALCGEYPALVVSKVTGIPPDVERIASTVVEDRQVAAASVATMRDTLKLVTSLAASAKSSRATVAAEQQSFTRRAAAGSAAHQRYKAAVASKSASQLAGAPKLLEAARTEYVAAAFVGESLVKHAAELREHERKLVASIRSGDSVALQINRYARDATNAALILDDALQAGTRTNADEEAIDRVKALRDQTVDAAKDATKAATEATELARKAHTLAGIGPGYDAKEAESRASTEDDGQKKRLDEVKHELSGLSGTAGNLCEKPMLERSWKASKRTSTAHGAGLVPVVLHTLDAKTLGRACPFLRAALGVSDSPNAPAAGQSVDVGLVPFADLGLEIMVLIDSGPKCTERGCGHSFFVNEGGGFTVASSTITTTELAGFARKGVDIFAELSDSEWKLRRTPGKPPEFVLLRSR